MQISTDYVENIHAPLPVLSIDATKLWTHLDNIWLSGSCPTVTGQWSSTTGQWLLLNQMLSKQVQIFMASILSTGRDA